MISSLIRRFQWLQKDELEKILLEIQGVVAVINIKRREEVLEELIYIFNIFFRKMKLCGLSLCSPLSQ